MPGETNLSTLLSTLTVTLDDQVHIFFTLPNNPPPSTILRELALSTFQEKEGMTFITTLAVAQAFDLTNYVFPCKMITCNVHSSLEAIGFMAAITTKLAEKGVGCNPISGFYHDHLFVPLGREKDAMEVLERIAAEAQKETKK